MSYDYTRDDDIPFDNTQDYELASDVVAGDESVEQIEAENQTREIPPGDHIGVVRKVVSVESKTFKSFVNGMPVVFTADQMSLLIGLVDDPRSTTFIRFTMPPRTKEEALAYWKGVAANGQGEQSKMSPGSDGKQFMQFINRLGFSWLPGMPLPAEARKPANWIGRPFGFTMQAGRGTYTDRSGVERPRNPTVKWFSYTTEKEMRERLAASGKRPPSGSAAPLPGQRNLPINPVASVAAAGLDDV